MAILAVTVLERWRNQNDKSHANAFKRPQGTPQGVERVGILALL